jgi:hypothetical protein
VSGPTADTVPGLIAQLEAGDEPPEGDLLKALRRASCPGKLVELLARSRTARGSPRLLPLLLRHPACPRQFAWEALPRLGWRDLLQVTRDPRTAPPVRRQSERKLVDKLQTLTLGERTAVARLAPRSVIVALLAHDDPVCVEALLSNPQFTETEAVRLLQTRRDPACILLVLHHPTWGTRPEVLRAAVRSDRVPLGVALGLVAALPESELVRLLVATEAHSRVREAARKLLRRRRGEDQRDDASSPLALC